MDVTNTANQPRSILDGLPGSIEASEARGQHELVASTQLPCRVIGDKSQLEAAGVVFGEPTPNDPLFCEAKLPAGWKKEATDHSMWSKLVDDKGRTRASIFYKAAFYDRDAFLKVNLLLSDRKSGHSIGMASVVFTYSGESSMNEFLAIACSVAVGLIGSVVMSTTLRKP